MSRKNNINLPFMKMHGLGNDFVVFDARASDLIMTAKLARALGNRHLGVGFDQLAVVTHRQEKIHLAFYNSDGSTSAACGNATRCIARYIMDETGQTTLELTTDRGNLQAVDAGQGLTSVNMGHPQTDWNEIPLAREMDTLELPIEGKPTATGMGNPHCTFFVDDLDAIDVPDLGLIYEKHPLFPERTNVQVAQVIGTNHLRMRVWERGVGMTLASGSSSCAVAVAAVRRGLTGRRVQIDLDGGCLAVEWGSDGVWMTGPTCHVFTGTLTRGFLESLT
ncbi:MAG: diaminopimelate epimerase [Roseobacter sp.]